MSDGATHGFFTPRDDRDRATSDRAGSEHVGTSRSESSGRSESGRSESGRSESGRSESGRSESPSGAEAFLITDAPESFEAQHRARVRKYLTLMAFRVPALIIAGIVYSATGNGLLALAIVALSIPLPWVAVLIANDRPPRKRGMTPSYLHGPDHSVIGPPQLDDRSTQPAEPESRGAEPRTIDSHTVDPDDEDRWGRR